MTFWRRLRVFSAITVACAAAGAAAGLGIAAVVVASVHNPFPETNGQLYRRRGRAWDPSGALLGPFTAMGFLRRVPVGRLFAELTAGAAVGGVVGFAVARVVPVLDGGFSLVVGCGTTGFAVAAFHLWWRSRLSRNVETLSSVG